VAKSRFVVSESTVQKSNVAVKVDVIWEGAVDPFRSVGSMPTVKVIVAVRVVYSTEVRLELVIENC
jgi:hypothetical protein